MTSKWIYTLTDHEMDIAGHTGRLRCLTAQDDDSTDDTGIRKSYKVRVEQNITACIAEIAVARMLNCYWSAMAWKQPDVGGYIEVRSIVDTRHNLVVRAFDKDNSPMVLVHVDDKVCTARGWDKVSNIKEKGIYDASKGLPYWRAKPDHKYRPMEELLGEHLKWQVKKLEKIA